MLTSSEEFSSCSSQSRIYLFHSWLAFWTTFLLDIIRKNSHFFSSKLHGLETFTFLAKARAADLFAAAVWIGSDRCGHVWELEKPINWLNKWADLVWSNYSLTLLNLGFTFNIFTCLSQPEKIWFYGKYGFDLFTLLVFCLFINLCMLMDLSDWTY